MVSIHSIFGIFVAVSTVHGFLFDSDVSVNSVTVSTTCGPVQGTEEKGVYIFRGIPYAKPPVQDLRWRSPQPLSTSDNSCWNGTYKATNFSNMCLQRSDTNVSEIIGNEDCLYINVWSPAVNITEKRPVMVWIHGGSLQVGSGNDHLMSPNSGVVKSTEFVFVSMNYRLHAFGFMALDIFAKESSTGTSGNYGFMDQILALHWVQDNIANFGGDPNQVTVFGQSSGGTCVFALLASPLSQGLFHRAWLLSASPVLNKTSTDAFKDNLVFLNNTGCKDPQCLRRMNAVDVTLAVPWDIYPYWSMDDQLDLPTKGLFDGAIAIIDGYVLKEAPFDAWVNGNMVDVPILIGTTAQEVDGFPKTSNGIDWNKYETLVKTQLSGFDQLLTREALQFYPPGVISPEHQYTTLTSNVRMTCGNDYLSLIAASCFKSPVYRYIATYFPSQPADFGSSLQPKYAFHGLDLLAFFGTLDGFVNQMSSADVAWQNNVQREAITFVKSGHPYNKFWKTYPTSTALLSDHTTVTDGYKRDECMIWMTNGLFSYSWIN